jgi:hypothetical protein
MAAGKRSGKIAISSQRSNRPEIISKKGKFKPVQNKMKMIVL